MEVFKKKLKNRIIITGIYILAIVAIMIAVAIVGVEDEATSFTLGFGCGIGAVALVLCIRDGAALKNEEKLKRLYIEETDERRQHINAMVGSKGMVIFIAVTALAMLISNYFNQTVFFTLLAALGLMIIIKAALVTYYKRKF